MPILAASLPNARKIRILPTVFSMSTYNSFILALLLASRMIATTSYALSPDGKALLKFKKGIKASNDALANWKEDDKDPCNWLGVTCDPLTRRVIFLSLPFRKLSGHISPSLGELGELRKLRLHHNSLFGSIPSQLGNCSRLKALYLETNYLSGYIPSELGNLSQLMIMDLSSNSLVGRIPDSFGNLQKLNLFNVSTNFLTGKIPEDGILNKFSGKSFGGNLQLCGRQVGVICMSQLEGNPLSKGTRNKPGHLSAKLLVTALGTVGVSFLIALLCFWGCFLYKHINKNTIWGCFMYKHINKNTEAIYMNEIIERDPGVVSFHGDLPYSSNEILKRIELLGQSSIIGCGGFGTVYKLVMEEGSVFALKKIENSNLHSDRSFERELQILGSIKHRNLVNLRGYCKTTSARLLIYDYLSGGTLDETLHGSSKKPDFPWSTRKRIALGAAKGLAYLHHDCSPQIIHRDIKSSNILLGENLEPYVSDFGLAKLVQEGDSNVTKIVAGTFGYLAPEYVLNGKATEKSDVYSYGVVLLELISGKRSTDPALIARGLNLVGWVNALVEERRVKEVMDPNCECTSAESMEAVLSVAMMCINSVADARPTMYRVVRMLEMEADHHQRPSLSESI